VSSLPDLLLEVAGALAPLADEIPDLNIYPYWCDLPTPPALDVYPGSPFQTAAGVRGRQQPGLSSPSAPASR
jgi:hypothetical protein